MNRTVITAALCLCLTAMLVSEALSETAAGQVLSVRKEAYRIRDAQTEKAEPQMPLLVRDAVRTGARSRAKLFFTDDSIINLGELSQMSVEQYIYNSEKERSTSILKLVDGSLKAVVGRSDLEVHTPTAVAAARGTKFIVSQDVLDNVPRSCIMVLAGEVDVSGLDKKTEGRIRLRAGWMSFVPAGGPPQPAIQIPPSLLMQHSKATRVLGQTTSKRSPKRLSMSRGAVPPPPATQQPTAALSTPAPPPPAPTPRRRSSPPPPEVVAPPVVVPPPVIERSPHGQNAPPR